MRAEKQLLLDEIKDKIDGSNGLFIIRYQRLNASRARLLRDVVSQAKGEFEVVKKRIFCKALAQSRFKFQVEQSEGDMAVLFAYEDPAQLSKAVLKYSDDNEKSLELLGAVIEGGLLDAQEALAFATLPSMNEMRSQIVGTLAAPLQEILALFEAFVDKQKQLEAQP